MNQDVVLDLQRQAERGGEYHRPDMLEIRGQPRVATAVMVPPNSNEEVVNLGDTAQFRAETQSSQKLRAIFLRELQLNLPTPIQDR